MFKRGQIIANRYIVKDLVGRGGMGRIYKVYDKALGEEVALKTLLPEFVKDKMVMDRFFNEARIARGLSHPNIIRVHDIGGKDGTVYISMELLAGKSLRELLDDLKPGQRLPIAGILRMFDGLCAALDYAHTYTIHRDIKPENVMILPDGSVKLMDFGISKLKSNPNLTSASIVMGTPQYMSPEQLKSTSTVDGRADIYSVGVMLYEVITGTKPTALGKAASEVRREVPASIDPIIEKCVHSSPAKRFQTVGELRQALRSVRIALETQTPEKRVEPIAPSSEGRGVRVAAGVVLLISILAGAVFAMTQAEKRRGDLLEAAAVEMVVPGSVAPTSAEEDHDYAWVVDAALRARARASETLNDFPEGDREGILNEVWTRGDGLLAEAEALSDGQPSRALELASDALSCFVALIVWPEDMVFVVPGLAIIADGAGGDITTKVEGFFIDRAEVRMAEFSDFCDGPQGWRWPRQASSSDGSAPMNALAYYDALAFVATRTPAKMLPTEAQWARAVLERGMSEAVVPVVGGIPELELEEADSDDEESETASRRATGILYMQGEKFYEWTRSLSNDVPGSSTGRTEADFGVGLIVRGGAFDSVGHYQAAARDSMLYESVAPWLGFRGVMELPESLEDRAQMAL